MRERPLLTQDDLRKAATDLIKLGEHLPLLMTLTEGKETRRGKQNARYWATLSDWREMIENSIMITSVHTGYTPLEVRRLAADRLPHEQAAILFIRKSEGVHDVLKACAGIPTSTRLGTKEFSKFDAEMERVMAEILGEVNAVQMKAGA